MWFNRAETKTMIKKEIKMTVVARVFKFMLVFGLVLSHRN